MSIPRIASYPMPDTAKLPAQRLDWQPDASRAALLIHDMQNYFLDFFDVSAEPIPTLVANLVALRERCDELGIPVFYTAQPGQQTPAQRGLLTPFWGPGITAKPEQAEVFAPLAPKPHHHVLDKWRYSAFQQSPLKTLLEQAGRDQLIIGGIYAHIGVLMTAGEAFMRDVHPCLVADALADFSPERHAMALEYVAATCGSLSSTADLLAQLSRKAAAQPVLSLHERVAALLELDSSEFAADDNLLELGLDSIRLMTLVGELQEQGYDIGLEHLAEYPTLQAWQQLLEELPRAA